MSVTMKQLIMQIEELRIALIRIKVGKEYTDPEVILASQKLDDVLNIYQELTNSTVEVTND